MPENFNGEIGFEYYGIKYGEQIRPFYDRLIGQNYPCHLTAAKDTLVADGF